MKSYFWALQIYNNREMSTTLKWYPCRSLRFHQNCQREYESAATFYFWIIYFCPMKYMTMLFWRRQTTENEQCSAIYDGLLDCLLAWLLYSEVIAVSSTTENTNNTSPIPKSISTGRAIRKFAGSQFHIGSPYMDKIKVQVQKRDQ